MTLAGNSLCFPSGGFFGSFGPSLLRSLVQARCAPPSRRGGAQQKKPLVALLLHKCCEKILGKACKSRGSDFVCCAAVARLLHKTDKSYATAPSKSAAFRGSCLLRSVLPSKSGRHNNLVQNRNLGGARFASVHVRNGDEKNEEIRASSSKTEVSTLTIFLHTETMQKRGSGIVSICLVRPALLRFRLFCRLA